MQIYADTSIKKLAEKLIDDLLTKKNFEGASAAKGSFLTGGSVIVCESKGLQEYIQKTCVDEHGIWTALPFKPLAGFLMQCAYNLSAIKKDESENVFNQSNLVWAIYRMLEGEQKTFFFANELASLFMAYQIYRPKMINNWNNRTQYTVKDADYNFIKNEKFQRDIWVKLRNEYKNEQDIKQLYDLFFGKDLKIIPRHVYIFCPVSIAPVQLDALRCLSKAGCKISIYINQISNSYFGDAKSEKSAASLRKKALEQKNFINDNFLNFYDIGNKLIANMGKAAQVLYEQIDWNNLSPENDFIADNTLLGAIKNNIFCDDNFPGNYEIAESDDSVKMSSCYSHLREIEVLSDYLLDLFLKYQKLTPYDIAVVSPDIKNYASAIDTVFSRCRIPYMIADRGNNDCDKTTRLLNSLFAVIDGRFEAPEVFALFEYSLFVQGVELDSGDAERLFKWINENAVRHGYENNKTAPDYSFKTGFRQLLAGFFMIPENNFSEINDYCYPDIEGTAAGILGDFIVFTKALNELCDKCKEAKTIEDWDECFKEYFKYFFGADDADYNEDELNPYQNVISAWDSLKREIIIGFGNKKNETIDFSVIKNALPAKLEDNSRSSYYLCGRITCSDIDTVRAVPYKVICLIGMNGKEFPRQIMPREISLMAEYERGDKDTANEDRLMFLETIISCKEKLYISWIGQDEKTKDELEPSSCVVALLRNLQEQYGINENKIVTKHPLQPFSKKYFTGALETYDNRWIIPDHLQSKWSGTVFFGTKVWEWRAEKQENKNKDRNIENLLKCFKDAPKYFFNEICNIYLPEKSETLDYIEPLIVEKGLEEWILADLIINNDDYPNKINISKLRGELPNGKFANELINRIITDIEDLKRKAESEECKSYIYPGKDKGKYRLRHWLYHLDLNSKEKEPQRTKMFIKDAVIELNGIPKEDAASILENIFKLKDDMEEKLLPVFPDPAWEYVKLKDKDKEKAVYKANEKIFGNGDYGFPVINDSEYFKIALRNAESLNDLAPKLEQEFIKCSDILFYNYGNYEIKGSKK